VHEPRGPHSKAVDIEKHLRGGPDFVSICKYVNI